MPIPAGFPYAFPFYIPGPPAVATETITGISPQQNTQQLAVNRLRQYLKVNATTAKPNVAAFIQVFCNQCDDLEDAFQQLYFYRQLANAYGVMLDNIGAIVGLPRNGFPDNVYQVYLRAQILADNSGGTTEDLNGIFSTALSTSADVTFDVEWQFVAAFVIYLTDPNGVLTQDVVDALAHFMQEARGAGIDGILEYSIGVPDDELFSFMTATDTFDINGSGPTASGVGMDQGYFRGATVGA